VLEIGSGTGQHAVYFAAALPGLTWQTSDRRQNHAGILQWIAAEGAGNVLDPLTLDVTDVRDAVSGFDAVFSANTAHIMSESAVADMIKLVAGALDPGGRFLLYGPFRIDGQHTSDSNSSFDRSLRAEDAAMGIRDLEWIDKLAAIQGLERNHSYAMPANNMLVVWQKQVATIDHDNA